MKTQVFVNLPVKDLSISKDFFNRLGFSFNPQFTDDKAACMVLNESGYVMLLSEEFFKNFTRKPIADAKRETEVLVSISADSKEKVDELTDKALSLGASKASDPQSMDGMYWRSFSDLDGHIWEIGWMDSNRIGQQGQH
jgi:predicted lactoylglutathione lyase